MNQENKPLDIIKPEELEALHKKVSFIKDAKGKRVAFYEYGDPQGAPIFFFHGTGSHIHGALLHKPAARMGYRIICPDRPGVGLSDFDRNRTFLDAADGTAALADHLGIDKFGAMGISGGNPTLLAVAYKLKNRLRFVVDLAGAAPVYTDPAALKQLGTVDRVYARLGAKLPLWLFQIPFSLLGFQQKIMKNPGSFAKTMRSSMCEADMKVFDSPDMQYLFMRDFQELFRQGAKGAAFDAQLIYLPWGFKMEDIETPIHIHQGTDDKWVPATFSQQLSKMLPNATLHLIPGQGHFYHVAHAEETLTKIKEYDKE